MGVLEGEDTTQDAVLKLGDGNPSAMMALLKMKEDLDSGKWLWLILQLDEIDCVGPTLHRLYTDVCGKISWRVLKVMEAYWDEKISKEVILKATSGDQVTTYEDLMKGVS